MCLVKLFTTRYYNFYLTQSMLNDILSFISKYCYNEELNKYRNKYRNHLYHHHHHQSTNCELNEIIIKKPMETQLSIQKAIDIYYLKFQKLHWNIKQIQDKVNDKYLVIHKLLYIYINYNKCTNFLFANF